MMNSPLRCYGQMKHINVGVFAISSSNVAQIVNLLGSKREYSKDKSTCVDCCKEVSQTKGKKVEMWPRPDPPPPAWRCECPADPQPPHYDPYRIKVPDIVVPPLPPSNAKELPNEDGQELFGNGDVNMCMTHPPGSIQDLFHDSPIVHPDYWKDKPERKMPYVVPEALPKLGYHGKSKYKYAFHEPWKPLDRMALLERAEKEDADMPEGAVDSPMLDCARTKGPCSVQPAPPPPPCVPPPPKPFPWIYVWSLSSFLITVGLIYKYYLYKEEQERLGEFKPIWRPRRKVKRPFHAEDLPPCVQYLIVGAGAAGWAAYRAIMEHDKKAKVFMISKEDCLPYRRPPMTKHLWWNPEPPDIMNLHYVEHGRRYTMYHQECKKFMDPVKFYRKKVGPAVSLATGWCVLRVDPDDHVVWIKTLCGERPMYYERLLLAPGSKAKNLSVFKSAPKSVRDKVCTLRTIRDFEIAYRKVQEAKHVVVIGGGCVGCELAWHLARRHKEIAKEDPDIVLDPLEVVQIYKDQGLVSNVLPEYLGEWAAEKIKCEGVKMLPKTQVYDAYETPDGRLELTLSNGTSLVTDYVFVAVGAQPREELAEPSTLELDPANGGFKVNTELKARTHLYIAGDAASVYTQWKDTRIRMEHLDNAEEQGYVAGANMTGYWMPYNAEPHYWLRLGDSLQMEVVGEVGACMPTVALFKPCRAEDIQPHEIRDSVSGADLPCYKDSQEYQSRYKRGMLFYLRDDKVVGMLFWNMPSVPDRHHVVAEMIRARPSYKDISMLAELLGFPDASCASDSLEEEVKEEGPCIRNWRVF